MSESRGSSSQSLVSRLDFSEELKLQVAANSLLAPQVSIFQDVPNLEQALEAMLHVCESGGVDLLGWSHSDWRRISQAHDSTY